MSDNEKFEARRIMRTALLALEYYDPKNEHDMASPLLIKEWLKKNFNEDWPNAN